MDRKIKTDTFRMTRRVGNVSCATNQGKGNLFMDNEEDVFRVPRTKEKGYLRLWIRYSAYVSAKISLNTSAAASPVR